MLTPNTPWRAINGHDEAARLTLTISDGGSTESDDTEVTVIPEISLPRPAVMTLTPPVRWRIAPRNSSAATAGSIETLRTMEFMATSQTGRVFAALEQVLQDLAFQRGELGRTAPARPRQVDRDILGDPA